MHRGSIAPPTPSSCLSFEILAHMGLVIAPASSVFRCWRNGGIVWPSCGCSAPFLGTWDCRWLFNGCSSEPSGKIKRKRPQERKSAGTRCSNIRRVLTSPVGRRGEEGYPITGHPADYKSEQVSNGSAVALQHWWLSTTFVYTFFF